LSRIAPPRIFRTHLRLDLERSSSRIEAPQAARRAIMHWITTSILLDQLKEGADVAWAPFCERFRQPVVALALKLGCERELADDVAQETMLAFLEGLRGGTYERGRGRLSSWLFGIAGFKARQARDAHARRARERGAGEAEALATPDPRAETALLAMWNETWASTMLDHCLGQIRGEVGEGTFRAFAMVVLEKRAPADAAAALGITRNAVFIAKHRVLKRLRALRSELEDA
jgi:DNA-directed RNA polymerase specialized sigma24 family protein